jgi:hypothetical protein
VQRAVKDTNEKFDEKTVDLFASWGRDATINIHSMYQMPSANRDIWWRLTRDISAMYGDDPNIECVVVVISGRPLKRITFRL